MSVLVWRLHRAQAAIAAVLVGAPLLAYEFEARTTDFAWAQSVTRKRWLLVKIGWTLLAAAAWGGAIASLVTWWSGPRNALLQNAFQPTTFDLQGLVPVGYAVFATMLGIAAGALLRRTLPAIAVTLGGFIGLRLLIGVRGFATYQPASHYWPFQGIETGIYVALALVLLAVTYVVVTRRDA